MGSCPLLVLSPKYSVGKLGNGTQNVFENECRDVKAAFYPRIGGGETGYYAP
jgi:hypothetical protein